MKKLLLLLLLPVYCFAQVKPEQYAQGKVIGYSTVHSLSSAGYTLATATAAFPRTAARYGIPLNIQTMTLDWACIQEAMYVMEDSGITEMDFAAGKYYYVNNSLKLPLVAKSTGRSNLSMWVIDMHHSGIRNNSSTDFAVFYRYPKDQTEANTYLQYQYVIKNGLIRGNGTKGAGNIGILLGASTRPIFDDLRVDGCGIGIDLQFCLESSITNVNVSSYGVYGLAVRNGVWSGAAGSNAQSNIVTITNFRSYNSSGYTPVAALYMGGNHTIWCTNLTFEGHLGSQSHIFYDNTFSTGVNVFTLNNVYFEFAGCTKAGIRIKAVKGQFVFNNLRSSIVESDMKCLVEVEAVQSNGNWGAIHMMLNNATVDKNKGKFRCIGSSSYPVKWCVSNYSMANNTTFNSVENFDTSVSGSYIPKTSACRFVAPL